MTPMPSPAAAAPEALPTLPLVLRGSRRKALALCLLSLAFVAVGALVWQRGPWIGAACMLFFGLCTVVGALSLHPRSNYVELTPQGMVCTNLFRRSFTAWSDVSEFVPLRMHGNDMVGWSYAVRFGDRARPMRSLSNVLVGVEGALPQTYGMSPVELALLLNTLRRQYTGLPAVQSQRPA